MPRSTSALWLVAPALVACAQTQQSSSVTAPVTSDAPGTVASAPASAGPASPSATASATPSPQEAGVAAGDDTTPPAQFRACQADADCVAVDRVGCCHNGWKEAVAVSQKDAYARSFTCPQAHPICPMFIVQDRRTPRCDAASHLCAMVKQ